MFFPEFVWKWILFPGRNFTTHLLNLYIFIYITLYILPYLYATHLYIFYIYTYIYIYIYIYIYTFIYYIIIFIYTYISTLCAFIWKYKITIYSKRHFLFKISYILFCSKTLRLSRIYIYISSVLTMGTFCTIKSHTLIILPSIKLMILCCWKLFLLLWERKIFTCVKHIAIIQNPIQKLIVNSS